MTPEAFISRLTFEEKLRAYDLLEEAIASGSASNPPPEWHAKVLAERTASPVSAPRIPLNEAIQMVRDQLESRRSAT